MCGKPGCGGNIETQEIDMQPMTQSEFQGLMINWDKLEAQRLQEEAKKQQEEANKRSEEDWDCASCGTLNRWNKNDSSSAYCKKCRKKNEFIAEMILVMSNQKFLKQEQEELEDLKNEKEGRKPAPAQAPAAGYYQPQATRQTKPQTQQQQLDDANYHKKGEYFQCRLCDRFSVHQSNDMVCLNASCPSNEAKKK